MYLVNKYVHSERKFPFDALKVSFSRGWALHSIWLFLLFLLPLVVPFRATFEQKASLGTYFTQLCSIFLNKLTKIIVYAEENKEGVGRVYRKKVSSTKHPMFIKKHDKYTSAVRVYGDENRATSALSKYELLLLLMFVRRKKKSFT